MSAVDQHRLTIMPRSVWPAMLGNARATVAAHEGGEECRLCPAFPAGRCTRLAWARLIVADPEMLAAERQAVRS
ncbi:hypothetical protein ACI2K4_11225 [Micromonospora sp. NPDC050397]|uniref:hypothetical protein n=1 Tax=Micromonospora sp. NPDC050397 TaxID=3364279 RepID=UPI00384BB039